LKEKREKCEIKNRKDAEKGSVVDNWHMEAEEEGVVKKSDET